jgi:ferredoxin
MARVPVVNQDECTGCQLCTDIAGNTFAMNDDDLATVVDPAGDPEDDIQEAIDSCPATCISWQE